MEPWNMKWGLSAWNADTGGWCETCSQMTLQRKNTPTFNMHPDREIRKDYAPEVIPLELVGFAKQRVERLAQPLPVGRQSAHSKRRHILNKKKHLDHSLQRSR
jgi:hypothetical protein